MRRSLVQSRPGPNAFIDPRECVRPGTAPPAGAEPLPRAPGPATRWTLPSPRTGSAAEGLEFRIEARWSPGGPPVLITVLLPGATYPSRSSALRLPQAHERCPGIFTRDGEMHDTE